MSRPAHSVAEAPFRPEAYSSFTFDAATLAPDGAVELHYSLDGELRFCERWSIPLERAPLDAAEIAALQPLLGLLHRVAGVSYYKAAVPPEVRVAGDPPGPAQARLLEALYSEGLGEFAFRNELAALPRPGFPAGPAPAPVTYAGDGVLVPIGGGKDSLVAVEIARRTGGRVVLFSVGDARPIARTSQATGLPRLVARRQLDPLLLELNAAGALNGHVPVTAVVSCAALLTAAANGLADVAMANERSASFGNVAAFGTDINHQFSKGIAAERLLRAALAEIADGLAYFSVLRPASELAIARAFAQLPEYHDTFTSCNAVFRLAPDRREASWCCNCPKCRFVFLALAPFAAPAHLREVFGCDLLGDASQYDGFAQLAAIGGHKPFECVGEEQESVAAFRLLAADDAWRDAAVVRRFASEELPRIDAAFGRPEDALRLSPDHHVPERYLPAVHAVLGPGA
jgi:hypothetical protein